MDWDALKKRGMEMTKDEFWHPEKGGVLSATVQVPPIQSKVAGVGSKARRSLRA